MIRNKTLKFNMDNPEERELWEWLQQLPHGYFSDMTKGFWKDGMEKNKWVDRYIKSQREDQP